MNFSRRMQGFLTIFYTLLFLFTFTNRNVIKNLFLIQLRARMAGVSMAFSFFCSSMTVLFYTPVANQFGPYVVFYTFSAVTLLGVIYTVLWVPETKGKSLDEIQRYWKKDPEPVFVWWRLDLVFKLILYLFIRVTSVAGQFIAHSIDIID